MKLTVYFLSFYFVYIGMSDVLRHMAHLYMAHHMAALLNEAMPQSLN